MNSLDPKTMYIVFGSADFKVNNLFKDVFSQWYIPYTPKYILLDEQDIVLIMYVL